MAVSLTGTGGLFTRLGRIGRILDLVNVQQSPQIVSDVDLLADEYNEDRDIIEPVQQQLASHQSSLLSLVSFLRSKAQSTLIEMVNDDNPQPDKSLATALIELIRQIEASGDSVEETTCAAATVADAGNNANANVVVSLYSNRGKSLQNVFAEDVVLTAITDAQEGGGATAGQESLTARGEFTEASKLDFDWPRGSGCYAGLTAIDAEEDNAGGNLLTNSSFNGYTTTDSDQLSNWVYGVGEGQLGADDATGQCVSSQALLWEGDGATLTQISQEFGNSTSGTAAELTPLTQYAFNLFLGIDSGTVPTSGEMTIELWDADNDQVLADEEGNANAYTIDLTTLTTDCEAVGATFRTPRVLPDTIKIRLRLSEALPSGTTLVIDHLAMGAMTELYAHGPSIAVFSANAAIIREDRWTMTFSNDREGRWQTFCERMFDMNSLRLQLPVPVTTTAPTIPETLLD